VTVLVTGSAGMIGRSLARTLPPLGWQLRGFDRERSAAEIEQVQGEITDPRALDRAMTGVRAVVHLAAQAVEAPWPVIRDANLEGTYQVFEAARRAGVRRLVYASTNHAVGFTPRPAGQSELPADTPPRPDTLYGVSKAFGEALARYYVDRYAMQVACLRIGTFADTPPDARSMATWLSPADCARLVDACLRTDRLGFALVWGVSANAGRWWSLEAGHALGYRPLDDAGRYQDGPSATGFSGEPRPSDQLVGGAFTEASFGIDEVAERAGRGLG